VKVIINAKPWREAKAPCKILIMRFQAFGDTVITLPYIQSIRNSYPSIEVHFFTREEVSAIPKSIRLFQKVITIGGGRNSKLQFILSLLKLPELWFHRYDAVIDLQNHKISRIIRKLLRTKAWSEFDRYSPISAGERTRKTIESLWSWKISLHTKFILKKDYGSSMLLTKNGYKMNNDLIVLNPAGYCSSRNWPLESYANFAQEWLIHKPMTQFVLLLLPNQKSKADYLKAKLKDHCIDLTGKANQIEAFQLIQRCRLVLSEDSGLMHMAWTQGTPTIALFSSSRKDWSAPQGSWSICLDSSDLECGPCNLEVCKYSDNRCLTRYEPGLIYRRACELLSLLA
jgi:heptosyltransferase II